MFPPLAVTAAAPDRLVRVVTLNVAGIRAALKKGLAEYCAAHAVDVLCLQEVKCSEGAEELAPLLGMFRFHYWCCGSKPGYAGVATFSNIEARAVALGMGAQGHDDVAVGEGRMLTLHFAASGLRLCNVYVPNAGRGLVRLGYRMQWDDAFTAWCIEQQAAGDQLLVVGDMNVAHTAIDLANPKTNVKNAGFTPEEREKFSTLLEKGGLADVFRQRHEGQGGHYSFWSFMGGARARNVGWRLDYALASRGIISSIEHLCYDHAFAASDHCPMHIDVSKDLFPPKADEPGASKAPKQKSIAAFFKKAK